MILIGKGVKGLSKYAFFKRCISHKDIKVNDNSTDLTHEKLHLLSLEKMQRINQVNNRERRILANREENYSQHGEAITLPNPSRKIIIADDFVDTSYLASLSALVMQSELKYIYSSPGERKAVIEPINLIAEDMLGQFTMAKIDYLRMKMKAFAQQHWTNVDREAGSILSWLDPISSTWNYSNILMQDKVAVYRYTDPHVDKANNFEYDLGCLLYLSSDFTGGDFIFMDEETDYIVQPKAGRLLLFTSSIENVHRVEEVTSGNRLLLSSWMTFKNNYL